ncbi:MAG: EAL domain-containing protein [Faecalicatena sp.]|uniref:EAL domain-containing protein n=1 Tax=Faecalicatena sp. TaxID=2005360 RepID=UPI0025889C62|nr:EAL domain-containing protein [Faecalicatena sp.]MCI6466149.1 EAL domain-containing protein [Faecalicatena sp.]MDY5619314.1 EAL domain-containing protein [Lachnospiraceae bacterium]
MGTLKEGTNTSAFVINKAYEIVHYNQTIQEDYPEVRKGDLCYQALCGRGMPCSRCPILEGQGRADSIVYNEKMGKWMEVIVSDFVLPDEGPCSIVIAKDTGDETHLYSGARHPGKNERDHLTSLYKSEYFLRRIEEFLKGTGDEKYCLTAIDIEHFKLFNEWYGQEAGDCFLANIGRQLHAFVEESGGIAGYMGSDDFCILLHNEDQVLEHFQKQMLSYVGQYGGEVGFLPSFGIYVIKDKSIPASMMYDRASIAVDSIKGNYAKRVAYYDSMMMQQMEENHVLLSDVQRGLVKEEFVLYLQPKCNMATGKIVGAEALVRWQHPERGLIMPGGFVPLLERSGFIARLDCYLWERVCRCLRGWIDAGLRPMPISVNVSRVDIYTIDVVEHIKALAIEYELPRYLLEVEITESAYAEDDQLITQVAEALRDAGFTVLMDDFGSGYSSLNILKDLNVDILKIDMKFLAMDEQTAGKGLGILEAITGMAKLIGMRMIAEGVETEKQVKLLLDMNCVYGQGFYFYRPMPVEAYEALMEDEDNFDFRGIKAKKTKNLSVKELLSDGLFSEVVIHKILGGIGFYKIFEQRIELLQVNEQYYKVTGTNPVDLEEKRAWILDEIYEEDREEAQEIFRRADRDILNGAEGDIRRYCPDGSIIWVNLRVFFMKEKDGAKFYYGAISNVTEQMEMRRKRLNEQSASSYPQE